MVAGASLLLVSLFYYAEYATAAPPIMANFHGDLGAYLSYFMWYHGLVERGAVSLVSGASILVVTGGSFLMVRHFGRTSRKFLILPIAVCVAILQLFFMETSLFLASVFAWQSALPVLSVMANLYYGLKDFDLFCLAIFGVMVFLIYEFLDGSASILRISRTMLGASLVLLPLPLMIWSFHPAEMNKYVVTALEGTPFQFLTNSVLLVSCALAIIAWGVVEYSAGKRK